MKRTTKFLAAALCAIAITSTLAGCGDQTQEASAVVSDAGLWSGATYTSDAEIGEGAHTVLVTVTIEGKSVAITVKSDKDNLAEMLTESGLVEGEQSAYGLYIKRVNGILADYDTDGTYWNLLQNGTPTAVGASSITVKDGDAFELQLTM